MSDRTLNRVCAVLACVLVVALTVFVAACGGSSSTTTVTSTSSESSTTTIPASSTTSVSLTGDEATIAANYVKFFDGAQPAADKIGLLENGEQYKAEIDAQAASPLAQMASVAVSAVTITSPTTAEVKYTILVSGQPALQDQIGKAVLQDGVWKVGADSFLALLALQGAAPSSTSTS